jgi:hypothetical protein
VRMGHPPVRIEVMNEIDGVTFEECRPAAPHQHPCACDGRAALVEAIVCAQQLHRTSGAGGRHRPLPRQSRFPA